MRIDYKVLDNFQDKIMVRYYLETLTQPEIDVYEGDRGLAKDLTDCTIPLDPPGQGVDLHTYIVSQTPTTYFEQLS